MFETLLGFIYYLMVCFRISHVCSFYHTLSFLSLWLFDLFIDFEIWKTHICTRKLSIWENFVEMTKKVSPTNSHTYMS
jgi:hypothetical protein